MSRFRFLRDPVCALSPLDREEIFLFRNRPTFVLFNVFNNYGGLKTRRETRFSWAQQKKLRRAVLRHRLCAALPFRSLKQIQADQVIACRPETQQSVSLTSTPFRLKEEWEQLKKTYQEEAAKKEAQAALDELAEGAVQQVEVSSNSEQNTNINRKSSVISEVSPDPGVVTSSQRKVPGKRKFPPKEQFNQTSLTNVTPPKKLSHKMTGSIEVSGKNMPLEKKTTPLRKAKLWKRKVFKRKIFKSKLKNPKASKNNN
uniref:Ribosomal protein S18 n=2 Tax=Chromera velia TaxID=505693 RepID=D9IXE0_9ALVE|nr:ribosomal protein S18 [Chromera velia]ADJ66548.1 ribosomal protein S18 [Chromera velia]